MRTRTAVSAAVLATLTVPLGAGAAAADDGGSGHDFVIGRISVEDVAEDLAEDLAEDAVITLKPSGDRRG